MNTSSVGLISIGIVIGVTGTIIVARWWNCEAERQRAKLRDESERAWNGLKDSLAGMDARMHQQHESILAKHYAGDDMAELREEYERDYVERRAKRLEGHEQSLIRQRAAWPF